MNKIQGWKPVIDVVEDEVGRERSLERKELSEVYIGAWYTHTYSGYCII